jgi:excisionase family DNA binding protein
VARSGSGAATAAADDWISDVVRDLKPIATIEESAAALRRSTRSVRRLVASGQLDAVRTAEAGSSRVLIPRRAIEKFLRGVSP